MLSTRKYDQEMTQSQVADRPMAPRGIDTDCHDLFKVKQPTIFLSKMIAERERAPRIKLETMAQNKTPITNAKNNKVSTIHTAFQ